MFDIDLVSWTPGGRQMSDRMMLNFVLENTIDLLKAPVFHSLPQSDLTYGSLDFRKSQEWLRWGFICSYEHVQYKVSRGGGLCFYYYWQAAQPPVVLYDRAL